MAQRKLNRLTVREIESPKAKGLYADGGGLYLSVDKHGTKRWVFVYQWERRRREMGLGSASLTKLPAIRAKAGELREQVRNGVDPIAARDAAPAPSAPTFGVFAEELLDQMKAAWRNPRTVMQWDYSLRSQAKALWDVPVDQVDTDAILKVLRPLWNEVPESARRLRGRIEHVLDAATAQQRRVGDNPARWKGHLSHLLKSKVLPEKRHFEAMPYHQVPRFMAKLRAVETIGASVLQFAILTAARSGEAYGCRWSEIDLGEALWTIPAERMKGGREHRVPLTAPALKIIEEMKAVRRSEEAELVFEGRVRGRPMSVMTMAMLLRRMEVGDYTVHGFRSSFRDWAGEETDYPREVLEAALAHVVGGKVERAYRRADALSKRRSLMEDWAAFLSGPAGSLAQAAPGSCPEPLDESGDAPSA